MINLFVPNDSGSPEFNSVRCVVSAYLDNKRFECSAGAFTPASLDRCQRYLGLFAKTFGRKHINDCHKTDLQKFLLEHPEWESTFTRGDAIGCVISCFRWAEDEFKIVNPYRKPKFLGPPLQPRPAITPEEYRLIKMHVRKAKTSRGRRARTREVFRAGLIFLWETGCRTKEMRDAEWDNLNWEKGIITLVINKTSHKTGKERIIPVRRVLPLLRWLHRRRRKEQKRIFVNSLGKPWSCDRFAKEFRRYARLAGVRDEISAYCCRHGLCVRLLEKGIGERQIADVLGHESTRYVGWYGRTTRTKADYLNKVLEKDRNR